MAQQAERHVLAHATVGAQGVVAEVAVLLTDERALERVDEFHAMWLGYYTLPHAPDVTTSMRQETRALLEDVVFDDPRSYAEVFQSNGTYVNDTLASLYGLPAPGTDDEEPEGHRQQEAEPPEDPTSEERDTGSDLAPADD